MSSKVLELQLAVYGASTLYHYADVTRDQFELLLMFCKEHKSITVCRICCATILLLTQDDVFFCSAGVWGR